MSSSYPPNIPESIDKLPSNPKVPVLKNYINGQWVDPKSNLYIKNLNPATNQVLSYIPQSKKEDVDEAAKAAKTCFEKGDWKNLSEDERATILEKIAAKISEKFEYLVSLESQDTGKPKNLARLVDIPRAISNFKFFASAIRTHSTGCHTMSNKAINYTLRRPVGVAGLITPWNLPLYLLSWKVAPALACGNSVVVKPSELTPMTANALAEIIDEVGLPKGVFNLVHGYGKDVGQAIVEHKDIKLISFTGGTVTGRKVAETAAGRMKKLSLELGGKNPMLIFDDADLGKIVPLAYRAAFANTGQVCLCTSRILVQEGIYDQFLKKFVELVEKTVVGDPSAKETTMGSLISQEHRAKVEYYIKLAQEEGGKIATGGKRPNLQKPYSDGAFLLPTVITDLKPDSRVSLEEIFGPVVTIHKFKDEEEAIKIANMVSYGLCASVCTTNLSRAHRVSEKIETGMVWVNTWLLRDLRVPFGGVKDSGIGREGGNYSLEFYSEDKNVCIEI